VSVVTQIQFRRDTAANWTSANPTLASGELGFETDTGLFKIGNGSTAWTSLSYAVSVTATNTVTLTNKTLTTPIITQGQSTPTFSTNAYTLQASDAGQLLLASNSSTAGTVNIPTDATTNFAVGTQITILQTGSGQLTIQAANSGTTTVYSTGVTAAAPKCRVQYSAVTLWKSAANTWYAFGDLA
jgi:Major tropism determinant N-terminal domain